MLLLNTVRAVYIENFILLNALGTLHITYCARHIAETRVSQEGHIPKTISKIYLLFTSLVFDNLNNLKYKKGFSLKDKKYFYSLSNGIY